MQQYTKCAVIIIIIIIIIQHLYSAIMSYADTEALNMCSEKYLFAQLLANIPVIFILFIFINLKQEQTYIKLK